MSISLLREEVDFVTTNQDRLDQGYWLWLDDSVPVDDLTPATIATCGTIGCLAGNAVLRHQPEIALEWLREERRLNTSGGSQEEEDAHAEVIQDAAARLFGLTPDQADVLFHFENTVEELNALTEALEEAPDLGKQTLERILAHMRTQH